MSNFRNFSRKVFRFSIKFLDFPRQDLFESWMGLFFNEKSGVLKVLKNLGKKCLKVKVSYLVSGIVFLT